MKIQIMVSESAGFTPTQEKKIVEGANLTLLSVSTKPGVLVKPGATIPSSMRIVSKVVFTISKIERSSKGTVSQVYLTRKRAADVVYTARELKKLLDAPAPKKTDRIGTKSMRFSTASDLSASGVSAEPRKTAIQKAQTKLDTPGSISKSIKDIDDQIKKLKIERKSLQDVLDKQAADSAKEASKAKEMRLAEKGIYFSVEVSKPLRPGEEKVSKPTLSGARTVRPSMSSSGFIYAVVGKKKQKVMTYTSTDPITKKTIKGKTWFFVSKEMKKKFG